ncbi:MAG: hypothetical protein RPU60_07010 [Candidatus Sedimenticola sp. (ex Thyasira tokunagai)]
MEKKKMKCSIKMLLFGVAFAVCSIPVQAISIHTSDFIADSSRTNLNGFEGMAQFYDGSIPYIEGGISVQQINGDGLDIGTISPPEGNQSWYPNGGDFGYTEIRLSDGSNFGNVGFFAATGSYGAATNTILFDLLDDGVSVLSGSIAGLQFLHDGFNYFGFGEGGFDTVRLSDNAGSQTSVYSGLLQALSIDAIEVSEVSAVPIPAAVWLFGSGILGLLGLQRKRKLKAV